MKKTVTGLLEYRDGLPYDDSTFAQMVESLLQQQYPRIEILIFDNRGEGAKKPAALDSLKLRRGKTIVHIPGTYKNRAAMLNEGLRRARGHYIMLLQNEAAPIQLKTSAVDAFVMSMERSGKAGLVFADYTLVDENGKENQRRLLNYHPGRLRDAVDFGYVMFYSKKALTKVGGFDERYKVGDLYDMRFKLSEKFDIKLIANKREGSLYTVWTKAAGHDVFYYLLASKESQIEFERALTEHLKRVGAYLAPDAHYRRIEYSAEEEKQFANCIASVIIPVNNRPEFIGTAIESVQNQTIKRIEAIVVVNGGPQDPTANEVRRYLKGGDKYRADAPPVKLLVLDINNIGLCLDMGVSIAQGKYYVQLDSDDRLKPFAVEKLLAEYEKDPRIGMVIGSYEVWQKNEITGEITRREDIPVVTHDEWTYENGRNNLLRINGAGAPRSAHIKVIKEMGWFGVNDSPYSRNYGEDYDLVLKTSENYIVGRVWEPIYEVIRHAGGTDHSIDQVTVDINDNAKDHIRLEAIKRRKILNKKRARPKA
jgi:glycosyltransferase involved in cell wall biosynthesis